VSNAFSSAPPASSAALTNAPNERNCFSDAVLASRPNAVEIDHSVPGVIRGAGLGMHDTPVNIVIDLHRVRTASQYGIRKAIAFVWRIGGAAALEAGGALENAFDTCLLEHLHQIGQYGFGSISSGVVHPERSKRKWDEVNSSLPDPVTALPRSAAWRISIPKRSEDRRTCRLEVGDTAGWKQFGNLRCFRFTKCA